MQVTECNIVDRVIKNLCRQCLCATYHDAPFGIIGCFSTGEVAMPDGDQCLSGFAFSRSDDGISSSPNFSRLCSLLA